MVSKKHFVDTSVMRPLITSSNDVKEYYKENLGENLYYSSYVRMEFFRGFIVPAISFYFTLKMPNIKCLSDAFFLWSNKFQTREIKAIMAMFGGLLEGQRFDFNDLNQKERAAQRIAEYIRRIYAVVPRRFKNIGSDSRLCEKSRLELEFDPNDLDASFKEYITSYSSVVTECNGLHYIISKNEESIQKIIDQKDLKVVKSKSAGFKGIVEEISDGIGYNCNECKKIGDLIIALISPQGMRMEHTDYSFDYLMLILDKDHFRHPSESQLLKK